MLYESSGYDEQDGTYDGNILPVADYYYIIDLKNGTEPLRYNYNYEMINKILLILFLCAFSVSSYSQQLPIFSV